MNNRILVTGGSGFIGTNLLDKFLNDGYEVLNIDFNEPKNKHHNRYWANIDINDSITFKACVRNFLPNYIVHLAARTDLGGTSLQDYNANILGVENLMNIVKELPLLKKVIITSSMLVCHLGYHPRDQFDYSPSTIYGESKVQTEKIVWENFPKCDWAILRPTSIWGPWFQEPYRNFFELMLQKKYFHIGNRGGTKTYGYIGNAVYQIETILFSDDTNNLNKVFYLGDYQPTKIEFWANEIAAELGSSVKKIPYPFIKIAAFGGDMLNFFGYKFPMTSFRLKNMTTDYVVDLSNTRKTAPNLPFSRTDGIKETLKWLKTP